MARTKTNTQNNTKTCKTPRRNRHFRKQLFLWFWDFYFFFSFLFIISLRNFTLPPWYGQCLSLEFKPVFRYSKPHTYLTFIGEENENQICIYTLYLGQLEHNNYKLKRCLNQECCKQCRYVMFKGTMTKWPVQKLTQGTTQKLLQHHDATDI